MRIVLDAFGVLLILAGGVWLLQGLNVLRGSLMSGQSQWVVGRARCSVRHPGHWPADICQPPPVFVKKTLTTKAAKICRETWNTWR
jgi:hypothetical protein